MKTYNLTIAAPHGLHLRVSAKIVELVRRTGAKVRLFGQNDRQADGGSVISLMTLGAEYGHMVRVEVEGRNELEIFKGLAEIVDDRAAV